MTSHIAFAEILGQLMEEKYKRNRAALAQAAHVSQSALSQYVRGRATPSLDVLVHLADVLDVSLDYLVFGREKTVPAPELGYLAGHLEAHVRKAQSQSAALHDLTARIGARLGELIRSTAEEMLPGASELGGSLSSSDVTLLERFSLHTIIVTTDLSLEVLVLDQKGGEEAAAPSVFAQVVAENIAEGVRYEYIIPEGSYWLRSADMLRREVVRLGKADSALAEKYLTFFQVSNACVPGFIVQHVVLEKFERQAPDLFERVARFVHADSVHESMGYIAYGELANPTNQHFDLIVADNVPRLLAEVQTMRNKATRRL